MTESSTLLLGAQLNDGSQRIAFKGAIDELHIFDAALLPEQIVQLNAANRTVGAEPLPK